MLVESLLRLVIKMLETSSERNFAGPQWNSANLYTANDTASNLFTYLHCGESLGILSLSLLDCFLSMFVKVNPEVADTFKMETVKISLPSFG